MLIRTDPFRELDRLAQQLTGTSAHPAAMPMDAWREGENFVVEFDLPGVDPSSIDLDIEQNVLTVRAERKPRTTEETEMLVSERPVGMFSRQVILGDSLNADGVKASYNAGVLSLHIPVAEKAKPRKIEITQGTTPQQQINA